MPEPPSVVLVPAATRSLPEQQAYEWLRANVLSFGTSGHTRTATEGLGSFRFHHRQSLPTPLQNPDCQPQALTTAIVPPSAHRHSASHTRPGTASR